MSVINSFFSAFLTYSKIPVPRPEWKEENRRYSLCFFPVIGAVIGITLIFWYYLCKFLNFEKIVFSAGCTVIPIVITGGIHLDGFCDVCDANASWSDREKKLEIMRDSHIGAFSAIKLCLYLILQTALFSEIYRKSLLIIYCCGIVMSRAFSGLAAVAFKTAKKSGMLQAFRKPAAKKATIFADVFFIILGFAVMTTENLFFGIFAFLGGTAAFIYYRVFSYRKFGGITGDLAGWFVQIYEIAVLFCTVFAYKISEVFK